MRSAGSHSCGSGPEVQERLNDVRRDGGREGYIGWRVKGSNKAAGGRKGGQHI